MRTLGILLLLLGLAGAGAWSMPPAEVLTYPGMCEASAAAALTETLFVVANDEDNLLRIYQRDKPGEPKTVPLDAFLKTTPNSPECDIEGAARVGDRIYWITSHGQSKSGKDRPNRHRFFATDIVREGGEVTVKPVGTPFTGLRQALVDYPPLAKWDLAAAAKKPPEDEGGLNIEGLAASADGQGVLIGFRNPLPQGQALVVELKNPAEVIDGRPPQLGEVALLTLKNRGIRSFDRHPEKPEYLIVAGSFDGARSFAFYRWRGFGSQPELIAEYPGPLKPEVLFFYPGLSGKAQILSDDGSHELEDGTACKDVPVIKQRFRAAWMTP